MVCSAEQLVEAVCDDNQIVGPSLNGMIPPAARWTPEITFIEDQPRITGIRLALIGIPHMSGLAQGIRGGIDGNDGQLLEPIKIMLVKPVEDRQGTRAWSGSEIEYSNRPIPWSFVPVLRQFVKQDLDFGKIDREKVFEIRPGQRRIVEIGHAQRFTLFREKTREFGDGEGRP